MIYGPLIPEDEGGGRERVEAHKSPTMKMLVTPTFFRICICSLQMIGTGITMIMKSVQTSVAVKTTSMLRVLVHLVKKKDRGAQFHAQFVPHWKIVAKKNEIDQAADMPIMTQQDIAKSLS